MVSDLNSWQTHGMTDRPAPRNARARVRAELTREISDAARRQLADTGSDGLSLRAVARELGMASSAVYRYFPSRDELLTALIIDAYTAVGDAATAAEAAIPRADLAGRWLAVCRATRAWALDHPHEYALIFGSPVPGYRAPTDTIDPAAKIPLLMLAILAEAPPAAQSRSAARAAPAVSMPRSVQADLHTLRAAMFGPGTGSTDSNEDGADDQRLGRAVMAWTQLIGSISFELFGHLNNVISDYAEYFDFQMRVIIRDLDII
ncbi:MAG: transcriptional regulator, TetR family [Frankiales bacterium]|nr:transcriptional regulator, TetR family [Frankiales bacterium]